MVQTRLLLLTWIVALSRHLCQSFAPQLTILRHPLASTSSSLQMLPEIDLMANNLLLATIDSDIANIPTNEFRTVFLGGLGVIAGGFLSTIAVGAILEASNGYAAVVAESYDLEADEEFWKGLSDEEAKKARDMLAKVKAQRGDAAPEEGAVESAATTTSPTAASQDVAKTSLPATTEESKAVEEKKEVDMFSDY